MPLVPVGLNVKNLFDHDTVTRVLQVVNRDTFNVSDQVFFSGTFDPIALQEANPIPIVPTAPEARSGYTGLKFPAPRACRNRVIY